MQKSVQIYPHSSQWDKVDPTVTVRGTKETEPRIGFGGPFWARKPNTSARHKPYSFEDFRIMHELRKEAWTRGILLPIVPCPYKVCASCEKPRAYWAARLAEAKPCTLSLL